MENKWRNLAIGTLIAAMLITVPWWVGGSAKGGAGTAHAADQSAAADRQTITVSGQGEIQVDPDVAYINVGVVTEAETAKDAQTKNADAFASLNDVLTKQYAIADKDIQVTDFQVQPKYNYSNNSEPKIVGYTATHNVKVTYRKLDQLGKLLDALSGAGANRINGVQFSTEKSQDYQLQALTKAMDNAKAKAETLAKYAGRDLKGIVTVQENGSGTPPVIFSNYNAAKSMSAAAADSVATPIQAGQLTITANVTVQYAF